jgi:hypothetical protein
MVTLIAVYTSDGCEGRCDAKCYDADQDECDCICGGRNHGVGKLQALDNTRELAESWIEHVRANGQDVSRLELAVDAMHEPLFSSGEVVTR